MGDERAPALAHHTRLVPIRVVDRDQSERLAVEVRRLVGFRIACSCGFEGQSWPSASQAQAEGLWHRG